jgi:DNA-binding MarR family transcriptional regulator
MPRRFQRRVPGVRYGLLERLVGYAVRRAQIVVYEHFAAAVAAGLTPKRFAALVLIEANPGITQGELAAVMGIARSGGVVLVDALARAGLVARVGVAGDRRQRALALTASGARRHAAACARVLAHDRTIAAGLTARERATLIALLDRVGGRAPLSPPAPHTSPPSPARPRPAPSRRSRASPRR